MRHESDVSLEYSCVRSNVSYWPECDTIELANVISSYYSHMVSRDEAHHTNIISVMHQKSNQSIRKVKCQKVNPSIREVKTIVPASISLSLSLSLVRARCNSGTRQTASGGSFRSSWPPLEIDECGGRDLARTIQSWWPPKEAIAHLELVLMCQF